MQMLLKMSPSPYLQGLTLPSLPAFRGELPVLPASLLAVKLAELCMCTHWVMLMLQGENASG